MFLNGYPYTDFHELNLDFLLQSMEVLKKAFKDFTGANSLVFAEPLLHDLTKQYAKNTIVVDENGDAFISLQIVPSGISLSNSNYWLEVFDFEGYVSRANKNFTDNYFSNVDRSPVSLSVGDWLVLDDVLYKVTVAIAVDDLFEVGANIVHFTVEQFLKDFVVSINQTVLQYKNDIDASEYAYRQQLAQDIADTTASLQAQLDLAISGATVDSEVINARLGTDGVTYPTLGDAIRGQIDKCLFTSNTGFDSVGDANNLVPDKVYNIKTADISTNQHLPDDLATEMGTYGYGTIYTLMSTSQRGLQMITTASVIYYRQVVYTAGTVTNSSNWRKVEPLKDFLTSSGVGFSSVGDANELVKDYVYNIKTADVATGLNLPSDLATELGTYGFGTIYTLMSTDSRGFQMITTASVIYYRQVNYTGTTITSSSNWRKVEPLKDSLISSGVGFSTVGDANDLVPNQVYSIKTADVATGLNLPNDLDVTLGIYGYGTIYTLMSTSVRGFQMILTSSVIYFRQVSYSGGTITGSSNWRILKPNELYQIANNSVDTFETSDTYSIINGAHLENDLTTNAVDCTPSGVYGAHESNIYVYNSNIYLVYDANKTNGTEDPTKYNIELTKTDLSGNIVNSKKVIAVGDMILGDTITECRAPFILPVNDTIHIYCGLKRNNTTNYKIYHVAYDITNDTFGSFEECYYIDPDSGSLTELESVSRSMFISNNWFSYDSYNYCTGVAFDDNNYGIAYLSSFTTFNFIVRVPADVIKYAEPEITAEYSSTYNKFLIAIRSSNSYRYLMYMQYDITNSAWEDVNYIPDSTARPVFFKYDGDIYLANNSPYSRNDVTIWKYLESGTWSSRGVFEPISVARLNVYCSYFSFDEVSTDLYMSAIYDSLTKIKITKIKPEYLNKQQINTTLRSLFSI